MATTAKKSSSIDEEGIDLSDAPEVDFSKARRGKSRHADKRLELSLAGVRSAVVKTQVDVSEASGMDQGAVSRLERRAIDDMEVGTLRKYLAAMGVELELVAIAGQARIVIRSPDGDK
jgi:hypothetical protein